jgi:ureidoglycolate lyase
MDLIAQTLTAAAFAPYGAVVAAPAEGRRIAADAGLVNRRPAARLSLTVSRLAPLADLPLRASVLERHVFSSQTFLPLAVGRYLVLVAPDAPHGGPDAAHAVAFVGCAGQGVTYRAGVWHHGMTALDRPAEFAVLMWCDGGSGDEEFVPLAAPLTVTVPDA